MRFGGENVTVVLPGGCQCPDTPHPADEVYLLPRLGWEGGLAADAVVRSMSFTTGPDETVQIDVQDMVGRLCRAYLEHQVVGWNLTDEYGAPLPYDLRLLLSDWSIARAVGDAADDLYSEAVLAPLVASASTSSPRGATADSTSPRTRSARRRPKP